MTAVALKPEPGTALVPAAAAGFVVQPAMSVDEAVAQLALLREFRKRVLVQGTDYGTIPGVQKPSLFKPGAEKLCNVFALAVEHQLVEKVEDWEKGFFAYTFRAVIRSRRDGGIVADCLGSCNSLEDKYRYRTVPVWEATEEQKAKAVKTIERKAKKTGKPFKLYLVANTEPYSLVNTLQKMAQKRAMIGAVLIATRASEEYTQDVEDLAHVDAEVEPTTAADADGVVLEAANPAQVKAVFEDASRAGLTKETFPAWYTEVLRRPWRDVLYEQDVKPLLEAAATRIAEKARKREAAATTA